jgi:phage terminase large subunit GpA-like protein
MVMQAISSYARSFFEGLRPETDETVSQWADKYRQVSSKNAEHGQWRTSRTPYMREIMDCFSARSPVEFMVLMKGAQIGGTEGINNVLGYVIDRSPGPVMIVQPTVELARRYSKQKLDPMIAECPRLSAKVHAPRSRDSGNTTFSKDFPGGPLVLTGANSAAGLRSMAVKILMLDEVDAYPGDVEGEGDPVELARARTRTFAHRAKIGLISTPTIEGRSRIKRAFDGTDQRYFHVPCPYCGHFQPLHWSKEGTGLQWKKGVPDGVVYVCAKCQRGIEERHKETMLPAGVWEAHGECDPTIRGYHLSALYSPLGWYGWADAVRAWESAHTPYIKPDELRTFINTVLGETWVERGDAPEWERIYSRRESYEMGTVPKGGILITAGADVQVDRIEVEIVAWGRGLESWSIEYIVLEGSSDEESTWEQLTALYERTWPSASGVEMPIRMLAVDSGYNTQKVYNWARLRPSDRTMVVKGFDTMPTILGLPTKVDVTQRARRARRGCRLWPVGVGTAKSELYARLRLPPPLEKNDPFPAGWCHFPEYGKEYFLQLTAEELVTHIVRGYRKTQWQLRAGRRNEVLDCRVYARAAAALLGIDRYDDDAWATMEESMGIAPGSEPVQTPAEQPRADQPTARPPARRESFWKWRGPRRT